MTLFKWNQNHEQPFLGQVASLKGNMELLTTRSNNASDVFGPNNISIGFYKDLNVTEGVIVEYLDRVFVMRMNQSQINLLRDTYLDTTMYFNTTYAAAPGGTSPDNMTDQLALFARDDDRLYIKKSDGTVRRLVDAGGGSIVIDEELKINNATTFYGDVHFNNSVYATGAKTFACFDARGQLFASATACDVTTTNHTHAIIANTSMGDES